MKPASTADSALQARMQQAATVFDSSEEGIIIA